MATAADCLSHWCWRCRRWRSAAALTSRSWAPTLAHVMGSATGWSGGGSGSSAPSPPPPPAPPRPPSPLVRLAIPCTAPALASAASRVDVMQSVPASVAGSYAQIPGRRRGSRHAAPWPGWTLPG